MKKICYIAALLLLISCRGTAQVGTNFEDLTLAEALAKAEQTGRKVFIDCYTKTCGPCKYMTNNIFPLKECGDYFNANYVCLIRDMEEGEGLEIAREYNVRIYPTFLILNPDGSLYCRTEGSTVSSGSDFVKRMKQLTELTEMNSRFRAGDRDAAFLDEYFAALEQQNDNGPLQAALGEVLIPLGVEGIARPENWRRIESCINNVETPLFRYIVDNRKDLVQKVGRETVERKIMKVYANEFRMYQRMTMDFNSRIKDMKALAADGYSGAQALGCSMLFRQVINKKENSRAGEVVAMLREMPELVPDSRERGAALRQLTGFEKVADAQQRAEARTLLLKLSGSLFDDDAQAVGQIISRLAD